MAMTTNDRNILRQLGQRIAEIGNLPVQDEKRDLWRRLNGLQRVRPLLYIDEVPWWEMNVNDELTLRCEDKNLQGLEGSLRRTIYQWDHFRGDMVVRPEIVSTYVIHDTGYGMQTHAVRAQQEGMTAADYVPIIASESDVEKIQLPTVTVDWDATERNYQTLQELFDGVVPVRKCGIRHMWFAPWDQLIQWYGITELYMDMMDRPQLVKAAIDRMVTAMGHRLDQLEQQGALSVSENNFRVGSGGLGITDELPREKDGPAATRDLWGTSTGQIFSEVSPDMHWEFCLQYEMRLLERFGLNCYGCCEPLHNKLHLMRKIPRLRKVSMSPYVKLDIASENMGKDFVFSHKPNPSYVAMDGWDRELVRTVLREAMDATRTNVVEIVLKDISTVRNEPQRLWDWETVAMEVAQEYA